MPPIKVDWATSTQLVSAAHQFLNGDNEDIDIGEPIFSPSVGLVLAVQTLPLREKQELSALLAQERIQPAGALTCSTLDISARRFYARISNLPLFLSSFTERYPSPLGGQLTSLSIVGVVLALVDEIKLFFEQDPANSTGHTRNFVNLRDLRLAVRVLQHKLEESWEHRGRPGGRFNVAEAMKEQAARVAHSAPGPVFWREWGDAYAEVLREYTQWRDVAEKVAQWEVRLFPQGARKPDERDLYHDNFDGWVSGMRFAQYIKQAATPAQQSLAKSSRFHPVARMALV
ncbi:hypothetical protein JCM8547_008051 [Rhodosporidiobolus lusitaniae]